MGKRYKKKNLVRRWELENLEKAVQAVKSGQLSQREAATKFGIPKSTVGDYCSGKSELGCALGRPQAIPMKVILITMLNIPF